MNTCRRQNTRDFEGQEEQEHAISHRNEDSCMGEKCHGRGDGQMANADICLERASGEKASETLLSSVEARTLCSMSQVPLDARNSPSAGPLQVIDRSVACYEVEGSKQSVFAGLVYGRRRFSVH